MSDFNKLKSMTADYKRLAFGKLFWWNFNRAVKAQKEAWKAPFRAMGLMK